MCNKHARKASILLWAYSYIQTSSKSKLNKRLDSTCAEHKENLSEVDKNYDTLREKHGNNYALKQLRLWTQLICLGNNSLDVPPNTPFWRSRKCQQDVPITSGPPTKKLKVSVRSELIDQLEKWHH